MSLPDRSRPMRHIIFSGTFICWIAVFVGCGGSEEPVPDEAATATESGVPSPPAVVQATPAIDADRKGKSDRDPDEEEEESRDTAQAGAATPPRITMGFGHSHDDESPPSVPAAGSVPAEQVTAQTIRPDSVEAWTNEDFLSAALEHDEKLLDAIDFKVKSAPGDASVAILLTQLLDPSAPSASAPSASANPDETPVPTTPESANGSEATPPQTIAPQSSTGKPGNAFQNAGSSGPPRGIDSVAAMILEAAVTYMPQGAAVGSVAGGVPGRIAGGFGNNQDRFADDESGTDRGRKSRRRDEDEDDENGMSRSPHGNVPGVNGVPIVGQLQDRQLVERVVDGLIANNSQNAWQSVFGIVAETVKTPLSAELNCEIVVERLVRNMDSNPDVIQPVLLTLLDSAAPVPPENRTACLRMFTAISAARINQLTGFSVTEPLPGGAPAVAGGIPGAAAGGGFFGGRGRRSRDDDEDDPGFNPQGINAFGGNAVDPVPSTLPKVSLAPEVMMQGASFLWSPKAVTAIVKQLENATDLSAASEVILLASTIPITEVRQAVCATFLRLHASGSDGLDGSGIFNTVYDPALLVVLKSLPRTRPLKETPGIMDSWTSGTENLVLALRNEIQRTSGSMKPYTDTLPVKLHKNAIAEISVIMEMPAGTDATTDETVPAATQLYYVRTTFTPLRQRDIEDLTSHYEGRTSGFSRPDPAKGVMWIEGVRTLPNGHRRSMDVIIEKSGAGGGAGGTFSVEIIVVETLDPKVAGPAEATQESTEQ